MVTLYLELNSGKIFSFGDMVKSMLGSLTAKEKEDAPEDKVAAAYVS